MSNELMKQGNGIQTLSSFLNGRKNEIAKMLPKGLDPERVIKTALMAAMENPSIGKKCTPMTIYRSVLQASMMGLMIGNGANEAYFIPYGDSCTFRASYLGWMKIACRSKDIDIIRASVVYSDDYLEISEQPPRVVHKPNYNNDDRGQVIGAVAVAYTKKDNKYTLYDFSFMTKHELDKARAGSKGGIWDAWPDEMMKKTVIRRLCKMLPKNEELNKLINIENSADDGRVNILDVDLDSTENIIDAQTGELLETNFKEEETKQSKSNKLKSMLKNSKEDNVKAGNLEDLPPLTDQDMLPNYGD